MLLNRQRALEWMRRCGLDVLVATSPVHVAYFSDYFCWLDPLMKEYMVTPGASSWPALRSFAVFPLEGEPALIVSPLLLANATDLWVRDLHTFGDPGVSSALDAPSLPPALRPAYELLVGPRRHSSAPDALMGALRARGLAEARIGLEMEGLHPSEKDLLLRQLPGAAIKDCTNLMRIIRAVKTAEEIRRLARAAEINEQSARESLALARPGRPVAGLVEQFRARVAALGADFDHFACGIRGLGIAMESNYLLAEGEVLYIDFGCTYQHYFSDSGRSLALGTPRPDFLERHAALHDCVTAGEETLRPGVSASVVQAAMSRVLEDQGLTPSFPHGHGLGLEVRDYPILVPRNGLHIRDECIDIPSDLALEENMVINLEAPFFLAGRGSLQVEKSFVVTAEGSRPLVLQDRALLAVPDV